MSHCIAYSGKRDPIYCQTLLIQIQDNERRRRNKTHRKTNAGLHNAAANHGTEVGSARQVKEFSSDQRKNALAGEQVRFIQRGESVAGSETLARSSPVYLEKIKDLERSYADACSTIAEWEAIMARFEACRSMLAMARQTLGL